MNPCLIFGPMLQPSRVNTSSNAIAKLFASEDDKKERTIPNECKSIVDVRDVAEAHVRCVERERKKERKKRGRGAITASHHIDH